MFRHIDTIKNLNERVRKQILEVEVVDNYKKVVQRTKFEHSTVLTMMLKKS